MVAYHTPDHSPTVIAGAICLVLGLGAGWGIATFLHDPAPPSPPPVEELTPPPSPTALEPASSPAPAPSQQQDDEELAKTGLELLRCEESLRQLGQQYATTLNRADQAEADAIRYREGLDKAVAELNRLGSAAGALASSASSRPSPQSRRTVSAYSTSVGIHGQTIVATGKLYNGGQENADVYLSIELTANGRTVETGHLSLTANAKTHRSWQYSFRANPQEGVSYQANVEIEER